MKRFVSIVAAFCVATVLPGQEKPITARQIVERIKQHVGVAWKTETVDTFKAGDPDSPISGIAVTMMATYDVLERAAASGRNLVITHEPTFYSHLDTTAELEKQNDQVLADKQKFIKDHNLVVWRFHDHWHMRNPDGILLGMTKTLGWTQYQHADTPHLFTFPETTLESFGEQIKSKLNVRGLRMVGSPNAKFTKIGFLPGAAGSARQIAMLERSDVELLVVGETVEWETVEYVADAVSEGKRKALIIIGHIPSEQAGMEECTSWLKTFVTEVPIEFIDAKEPFVLPGS